MRPRLTPQAQPAPTGDKSSAGGASSTTGIQARCAILADQKVFPGLQVSLTVTSGEVKGVLTLPVTAVEGRFHKGIVHAPATDGTPRTPAPRPVRDRPRARGRWWGGGEG